MLKAARFEPSNLSMAANHHKNKITRLKMTEMTIRSGRQGLRRVGRPDHGRLFVNSSLLLLGSQTMSGLLRY